MNDVWIWWVVQFILSSLDFIMIYFLSHTLMRKYIIVKLPHILLGIAFTVITSLAFYFLDGFTGRIINHLLSMIMVKFMIRRSSIGDLIVIYMLSLILMFGIIQAPIVGIMLLISQLLGLREPAFLIISQTLTAVVLVPVCKKFKCHKHFYAIHANVVLKLVLLIFSFFILILMSI